MATETKTARQKTPQQQFIEALIASQADRLEEAKKSGVKISRIRKEDLIGIVRFNNDFIVIHERDLEPFNF